MSPGAGEWRSVCFGLIVTGEGEEEFLASLLRRHLTAHGCRFKVIRRIGQRSPITSGKKRLEMMGSGKAIPDRDVTEIGLPARRFLAENPDAYVILIDDLEHPMAGQHEQKYRRYRDVFDRLLRGDEAWRRASVHFLVMMLEAYYFAHAEALNQVLGTELNDHEGDVEAIRHPKNDLKKRVFGFREKEHGKQICESLDLDHVLGNPDTCASLRTLLAWCIEALDAERGARFCLCGGRLHPVTRAQIDDLHQ